MGYKQNVAAFKPELVFRVGSVFSDAYMAAALAAHAGPVTRLDPESVREWSEITGVDAVKALDLDSKGLSRTACLCPTCPYYLKSLGPTNRPGKVSPALKAHLGCVPVVPGLHKAVFDLYEQVQGESDESYVGRVADLLRQGLHLEQAHPEAAKLQAKVKTYANAKAEAVIERIDTYTRDMVLKINFNYGKPGQLEEAVRAVMDMPLLGRCDAFEVLYKHMQALRPFNPQQ